MNMRIIKNHLNFSNDEQQTVRNVSGMHPLIANQVRDQTMKIEEIEHLLPKR